MFFYAGIDVGSLSSKAVVIDEEKKILAWSILPTGAHSTQAAEKVFNSVVDKCGFSSDKVVRIVATGYGRVSVPFADRRATEIFCHGVGAHYFFPKTGTIIDIGGQDSKIIKIDNNGKVIDFFMNNKCAAGTGRFLEIMADRLGIPLKDLGNLSFKASREIDINSVCTVFAESEIVNLIARNESRAEIVRGLHKAIVKQIWSMVQFLGISGEITMSGGVAKNIGILELLQAKIGKFIHVPEEPQIVGALGAALIAAKRDVNLI